MPKITTSIFGWQVFSLVLENAQKKVALWFDALESKMRWWPDLWVHKLAEVLFKDDVIHVTDLHVGNHDQNESQGHEAPGEPDPFSPLSFGERSDGSNSNTHPE